MEQILAVERKKLFGENNEKFFEGFIPIADTDYLAKIAANNKFIDRESAETDPSRLQIIPYIVVSHNEKFFVNEILKGAGEKRLHGSYALAYGGHINTEDRSGDMLNKGAEREFREEVAYDGAFNAKMIGMINSEATPVDSVHFGVVYHLKAEHDKLSVQESEKHVQRGMWMTKEELKDNKHKFGLWSQTLIDNIHVFDV